MYLESRKIAQRLESGQSVEEVRDIVVIQNTLQIPSRPRRLRVTNIIFRRLSTLDSYLLNKFVTVDRESSQLILLYALMMSDQLFQEFMRQVYFHKIIVVDNHLIKKDCLKFLSEKATQSRKIANWTEMTRSRLGASYLRVLRDCGLLRNDRLVKGVLATDVAQYFRQNGNHTLYEILVGKRR